MIRSILFINVSRYQKLSPRVFQVFNSGNGLRRVLGLPDLSLRHGPRHRPLDLGLGLVLGLDFFPETLLKGVASLKGGLHKRF